jgi:hypothetical protein
LIEGLRNPDYLAKAILEFETIIDDREKNHCFISSSDLQFIGYFNS